MSRADTPLEAAMHQAAQAILAAEYVTALTGAGISVESGIPPFRGPDGLWTKYGEPPMDGYQRFLADPKKAWEERLAPSGASREIRDTIARAEPNPGHYALVMLEDLRLLRWLITQNVDNLHRRAGSQRLLEIHGNATLVRCLSCRARFPMDTISYAELPPRCLQCHGILKNDTVAFGEPIPEDVLEQCWTAVQHCDCMLVVGTSALVTPAAYLPQQVRERGGTLIEVNLRESELTPWCQLSLRGPAGEILAQLTHTIRQLQG
ncbi:MAG: NAD-dependent deacetylase [Candidatus Tectimicrobiota bacterium]